MFANSSQVRDIFLGIDFGTTGCRIVAIDERHEITGQAAVRLPSSQQAGDHSTQDPTQWWQALVECLQDLLTRIDGRRVKRLAVDGTSGTLLLCDRQGNPISPALMNDDRRATAEAERISASATRLPGPTAREAAWRSCCGCFPASIGMAPRSRCIRRTGLPTA